MTEGIILTSIVSGLLGGILRGIVGITKSKYIEKDKFNLTYFLVTMGVSMLVGIAAGLLADGTWQIAFLAGYAGTDFIDSLYKLRFTEIFKGK